MTLVGVGFLACAVVGLQRARAEGWGAREVAPALGLAFVGGLVGGRLLGMVFQARQLIAEPALLLRPDKGGSVSFGALGGAALGLWLWARWRKRDVWSLADALAPVAPLGLGFARVGCFIHGCDFGRITGAAWGVRFPAGSPPFRAQLKHGFVGEFQLLSLPVHPLQLLLAALGFGLFIAFTARPDLGRGPWTGRRALTVAAAYFIGRFTLELLRSPWASPAFGFLNLAQWVCVAGLLITWWVWRSRARLTATQAPEAAIAKGGDAE
jgi:phosphatidylglycerol:prolipoprotein diacylglycerol transferase